MKKLFLSLSIALSGYCAYAQTSNSFPSTGNAVLGAPGYIGNSLQFQGSGETHFIRTESIGNSGNGNTRLRMYLGDDWSYDQGFEIIASRWDGLQRSLLYIPGNGDNASFYAGATFGGSVGIGTTNPDQKLTVNGTIHSKEVKVDNSIPVPDYVFEKSYKLPELTTLKSYLDANHHLPEIPSAAEIEKDGLNLGEMNLKLLKKVEELTLYVIEKDKQLENQQKQINELTEKLNTVIKSSPKN